MKNRKNIFRFVPSNSKKVAERFHAKLRNVDIESVECHYKENGEIERVDIIYEQI